MQRYRHNSVAIVYVLPSLLSTSWSTLLVVHVFVTDLLLRAALVLWVFLVFIIVIVLILVAVEFQTVVILEFLEGLDLRGETEGLEALLERLVTMSEHVFFKISDCNLLLPEQCHR